jgi:glutaminyl-peptide cyclotransferase
LNSLKPPASQRLFEFVEWQTSFGPRYPGSESHKCFSKELEKRFKPCFPQFYKQEFDIFLRGNVIRCANLIGVIKAHGTAVKNPLLIGTHFDTRLLADNEEDQQLRHKPIIGANDGGSGTAILLALAAEIAGKKFKRDIYCILFDAEDVGNIGGYDFAMGSRYFSQHPQPHLPGEVIIMDMVGGKNMVLNIDLHLFSHKQSLKLAQHIIGLGEKRGFAPFVQNKPHQHTYIVCDHIPFLKLGIPSFVLIDIDYPEWHTHADLPQAMCKESLGMIAHVLVDYLNEQLAT